MARKTGMLAILFADIAKSTHLYDTLGNKNAKKIIDSCLSLLTKVTKINKGTVVKTIGDEIMCVFPTALSAVEAARDMHESLQDIPLEDMPDAYYPNIYVGIQYGRVIIEGGDVFGDAVNVAARMVAQAKQRQIITTKETIDALPEGHDFEVTFVDKTTIKGKSGAMSIYEVVWEQQDVTVMLDGSMESQFLKARLKLKYQDQTLELDDVKPSASLGRQIHNDVVVKDNRVSRTHAKIEYRRGKFFLVDQSSNGTYVLVQGKEGITIKRDEVQLLGAGIIGLGKEVTPESPLAIHFSIEI